MSAEPDPLAELAAHALAGHTWSEMYVDPDSLWGTEYRFVRACKSPVCDEREEMASPYRIELVPPNWVSSFALERFPEGDRPV